MQEGVRRALDTILDDPEPRTIEEWRVVINILQKLVDTPGVRAVEERCLVSDLLGMPWPPVKELQKIAHEAYETTRNELHNLSASADSNAIP